MAVETRNKRLPTAFDKAVQQLMDGTADVDKLSTSENAMALVITMLGQLIQSNKENSVLKERVVKLENKVAEQDKILTDFERRLFKSEQYSSRSTAILTGLPTTPSEDVSRKVCDVLNSVEPNRNFTPMDLAHCHRNKQKPESSRPPTITVVFNRSYDKDRIMRKAAKDLLKTKRMNIHHHMGQTVLAEYWRLTERPDVQWVQYRGHIGNFAVKLINDSFITQALNCRDLESKLQ